MLKRFLSDRQGLSAVEFALIAPLLILFYFSTVEIDSALTVDRRVTSTASAIADLVAQDDAVDSAELTAIYTAAAAIMAPFDPNDTIELRISSIRMADDEATVVWSSGHNTAALEADTTVSMPTNILGGSDTVIMAEAAFDYQAPLAEVIDQPLRMTETFYLRPRRSDSVCLVSGSTSTC